MVITMRLCMAPRRSRGCTSVSHTHFDSNVLASSQTITGRFLRSLYVGRMTEYLSPATGVRQRRCNQTVFGAR